MRPSEVAALTKASCHLPGQGWGHLVLADSSFATGKAYTDDGAVHEHRGLKGRTKGRPTSKPAGQSVKSMADRDQSVTTDISAEPQVKAEKARLMRSVPSRIRTCAHSSGGSANSIL